MEKLSKCARQLFDPSQKQLVCPDPDEWKDRRKKKEERSNGFRFRQMVQPTEKGQSLSLSLSLSIYLCAAATEVLIDDEDIHYGASTYSWYVKEYFWHVPPDDGLLCSPIGNQNFKKKTKQTSRLNGRPTV